MTELIFCLMGPTASGKTALSFELVNRFPMEIISVDSAMVYRGMDIGTAKPNAEELARIPHYLLNILDPSESFSAAEFCSEVEKIIAEIHARGKIPLCVGGTMMYFNALQQGLSILPKADESLRQELFNKAQQLGWAAMHQELAKVDRESANRIHPHDAQRIQRALEIFHLTQKPMSVLLKNKPSIQEQFVNLILFPNDRAWLHERIAYRFDLMLQLGFVNEVEQLIEQWHLTDEYPSMRCVGYRQALAYLSGQDDYTGFRDKGLAATRQLAKRQLTWLRHWSQGIYISCDQANSQGEIIAKIAKVLDNPNKNS